MASQQKKTMRCADEKRAVWQGRLEKTRTGLTKSGLMVSKYGQIISIKKHNIGKRRYAQMVKEGIAAPPYKKKRKSRFPGPRRSSC